MKITLAMLWDILNTVYPELETESYGDSPVRGVKLTPQSGQKEDGFLYLESQDGRVYLSCGAAPRAMLETDVSLEDIFNALQDAYNRLRDWDMETNLALIGGCGVQELLDLSEEILGNPVTVVDPSFKLLALTRHIETSSPIFREVSTRGYLSADTVEFYEMQGYLNELESRHDESAFHDQRDYVSVIKALRVDGQAVGYITMPCTQRPYSQGMAERFAHLSNGVEQCMERELRSSVLGRYMYEYFLTGLIDGKETRDSVSERLRYVGLPLEGKFRLLELVDERESSALAGYLARSTAELLPNEKVFTRQGEVLILMAEDRLDWSLARLTGFLEEKGLSCGVSRQFLLLTDIRAAHEQTAAALRLGRRIQRNRTLEKLGIEQPVQDCCIYPYDRYAPYHMVEASAQVGRISPLLRQLIALDRREHTDHLRVLYGYLTCERRPTQTAERLHMHRNNVIYRISRIEELLHISLNDSGLRAELMASFYALELE